jgi:hypothetical protein
MSYDFPKRPYISPDRPEPDPKTVHENTEMLNKAHISHHDQNIDRYQKKDFEASIYIPLMVFVVIVLIMIAIVLYKN